MDQAKIGRFISELRKDEGLTQEQLAEKIGVTQKSVSRWETGKNMPDVSLLQLLSSELNISVSELLEGEKNEAEKKNTDEAIKKVIDYSASLKHNQVFKQKDVNFITGIVAILVAVLLAIGSFLNAQTVPTMIFLLVVIVLIFRMLFGRCPSCGKLLPLWGASKSCPFCGVKFN